MAFEKFSLKYFLRSMVFFTIGGLVLGIFMGASRKFEFIDPERYFKATQDSTLIIPAAYATNAYAKVHVTPLLPQMEINQDDVFTCWIPLPDRELEHLRDNCTLPVVDENLSRKERKKERWKRTFKCAYEYISIKINGRTYNDFSLKQEYQINAAGRQFGVRVFINNPNLKVGENMLNVTTQYPHPDSGEPRAAYVPFYYTPLN